jgi:hypothetical protein
MGRGFPYLDRLPFFAVFLLVERIVSSTRSGRPLLMAVS